jgi:IS1 family transposase
MPVLNFILACLHRKGKDKMNALTTDKKLAVLSSLIEGNSIRSTERMTGIHRDTICRLLVAVGNHCGELLDARIRNVRVQYVEADEIWTYVGKKNRHVNDDDPAEFGDQWVFVAMDAETKLIPSYVVGKRTRETTYRFLLDLQKRVADTRFQLTTDGYHFYERGVEDVFAGTVDFAQLIKLYSNEVRAGNERYSPSPIVEIIAKVRDGNPDPEYISTSYVERQNLTMRMHMRRFTRLTNAFSKRLMSLKAACALHFAHYNFCRIHSSLRVTPAMAAGISSEIWPLDRLLS